MNTPPTTGTQFNWPADAKQQLLAAAQQLADHCTDKPPGRTITKVEIHITSLLDAALGHPETTCHPTCNSSQPDIHTPTGGHCITWRVVERVAAPDRSLLRPATSYIGPGGRTTHATLADRNLRHWLRPQHLDPHLDPLYQQLRQGGHTTNQAANILAAAATPPAWLTT